MYIQRDNTLQKLAKDVTTELIQLFTSFDSYRQQWDLKAVEWYKKLVGYKDENNNGFKDSDEDDGRSNIFIPRTYQIIDTIRARYVMAFFKSDPYIEFIPKPSQMTRFSKELSDEKAQTASALVNEQLEKNDIIAKYYDYITSLLTFPLGILGVGWRYEENYIKKKVPVPEMIQTQLGPQYTGNYIYQVMQDWETTWDDNEITNIDYFDFWPDPKGSTLDNCRGVFQREFVTLDELAQRLNFLDYLGEGNIFIDSLEELKEIQGTNNLERGREQRLEAVGISDNMPVFFNTTRENKFNKNSDFEILHYWEDDRHAMLINREKAIYDGPSPYWRHRKKPFVVGSYDRLPNEFYGLSAVQLLNDLQEEENTIHNQRTDNVNFILNRMWKVRRGADIDESQLVSRPHGIVYVDRMEDIEDFKMADVAASAFTQQNIISSVMENMLATPPVVRGASSSGRQTATETLKQNNNADMRFDVKIQIYKTLDLKRLAYLMDMNNQQFIDSRRTVKLGMKDSIEWRDINPGDLIGEFDYMPASANVDPAANKSVRREQLSQMMQFLMQAGIPYVNYHELVKEWLQSFDIENAEKFIIPQQQWQMMQQQQQLMQMAQMQQSQQNRPTQAQQIQNAQIGRARGRRPQTARNPQERTSGQVR